MASWRVDLPHAQHAVVHAEGRITATEARGLYDELLELGDRAALRSVQLDLSAVEHLDTASAAAICVAFEHIRASGKQAALLGIAGREALPFELLPALPPRTPAQPREPWDERALDLGRRAVTAAAAFAHLLLDTFRAVVSSGRGHRRRRFEEFIEQSVRLGVSALSIVALLTFLTGVILGFQAAHQLHRFGAAIYMAEIVSLGVVREFAPLMTAIILAGRSGSAIAAELGTMSVRQEVEALTSLGIDPVEYLVVPRVAAMTWIQPSLTVLATVFGLSGGLLVAWTQGLPLPAVYLRMAQTLTVHDFALGAFKSLLFAWIVVFSGCHYGLTTQGGASSVGRNTTRAVVTAILAIVIVDSLVTTAWTVGGYGER